MGYRSYSREERKVQIIAALAIMVQHGKKPELTMYGIAKKLDMRPSTHLLRILREMVTDGLLNYHTEFHRPNMQKGVWELPLQSYRYPEKIERVIKIMRGGMVQGVLSL